MKKRSALALAAVLALAGLTISLAAQAPAQSGAQDKPADMKKLLAEIVGDYEFAVQGQTLVVQFTESEGQLYGAPVGQPAELISPVAGKALCFDITLAESGDYYVLQFVRNESGVIDKCLMTVRDMVVEGAKISKSAAGS